VELEEKFPNSCGKFAHAAIAPTQQLIAAARRAKLPIFFCTQDHRANNRPAGAISTKRPPIDIQPGDYDIHDAFKPQPQDIIIYKQRASIFQGTPLVSHLTLLGIRSLIVCGEATSGCVRASTVDAYSTGYHISVVEECTFDRAELTHKVNLFDIHHKYADVMHVDEVVAHLDGQSAPRV
jgi:nicotinamidase-related amidase